MKSVKIVTYCTCSSIGSVLQAFALKKALLYEGYESKIILKKSKTQKAKISIFALRVLAKNLLDFFVSKNIARAKQKRENFISEHIDVEYYDDYQKLIVDSVNDDCDCYVAGSDQIWNPNWLPPLFFLDFIKNKKRISYAASMGNTIVPDDKKVEFSRLLNNFDRISVREKECSEVINALTGKAPAVHIDPTFLISAEEWRSYETPYDIKEPYILLYMLYWDESLAEKVKELKQKTGLKVYAIKNGLNRVPCDKGLYDVGINEFLWLVDHAEYVVTSSFHGVAMSTIFNKKFTAVVNPASPSRIENLLNVLSVPQIDIDQLDCTDDFDYLTINKRIVEERARGTEYLQEALK